MDSQAIQNEINKIGTSIRAKGWKLSRKITQKSMRELEALGLSEYVTGRNLYQEIVHAVIAAATDAGGKTTQYSTFVEDGETWTETSKPNTLYALLNPLQEQPMIVNITRIGDTDYTEEMPVGRVEVESIEALAARTGAEIEGNRLICEWGNGEGKDIFEFEIIS